MFLICPECKGKVIKIDHSLREIYCSKCGLIIDGLEYKINGKKIVYDMEDAKRLGMEYLQSYIKNYHLTFNGIFNTPKNCTKKYKLYKSKKIIHSKKILIT